MKDYWKLGASSCSCGRFDEDVLQAYAANRIDAIEFCVGHIPAQQPDWTGAKKNADRAGVLVNSAHLPFYPFDVVNPAAVNENLRRQSVEILTDYLQRVGQAGIPIAVIHPSGEPNLPQLRGEMLKAAQESFALLAEVAAKEGVTVAVEDLPRTCIGNTAEEIETILCADDRLRACLDTNHLLIQDNVDFIRKLGKKIVTLHVSDYDFTDEKHWLPYEGKNDWNSILNALFEADYRGVFMYEVGMKAPKTLERGELTFADYRRNYDEVIRRHQQSEN